MRSSDSTLALCDWARTAGLTAPQAKTARVACAIALDLATQLCHVSNQYLPFALLCGTCLQWRAALVALVACALICCTCPVEAQSQYSGYAVLEHNVEYVLDMVCPTAGDVLAQIVISGEIINKGATFAATRSSSLPLPPGTGGLTTTSMVSGSTFTPSEYYFRIRCETVGGCAMNWDVMYYCKASTGTWLTSLQLRAITRQRRGLLVNVAK